MSLCVSMMLVGLRSLWAGHNGISSGCYGAKGGELTDRVLVKIRDGTRQLTKVTLCAGFRNSHGDELREVWHRNAAKLLVGDFRSRSGVDSHGVTRRDDKRIKSDDVRMRIVLQATNHLHLTPQRANASRGRRGVDAVNELDGDFGRVMLRGNGEG